MKEEKLDKNLPDKAMAFRKKNKLCVVSEEEDVYKDPQIICSLGLTNKD
ncbi:MAG: hypothetical protein JRE64_14285 [Deltaproteobacteria bacterium]|nr:hypothetical protein [Deltaproteobacteria bacterium]